MGDADPQHPIQVLMWVKEGRAKRAGDNVKGDE